MDALEEAYALAAAFEEDFFGDQGHADDPVHDLAAVDDDIFGDDDPFPGLADPAPGFADPAIILADVQAMGLGEPALLHPYFRALLGRRLKWFLAECHDAGIIPGQQALPQKVVKTVPEIPCLPEVLWVEKVGSVRAKSKWSMARKSGLISTPEGDAGLVYGSYGPCGFEF